MVWSDTTRFWCSLVKNRSDIHFEHGLRPLRRPKPTVLCPPSQKVSEPRKSMLAQSMLGLEPGLLHHVNVCCKYELDILLGEVENQCKKCEMERKSMLVKRMLASRSP